MPRCANEGPDVTVWHETLAKGDGSSTFDLCRPCARQHDGKPLPVALMPYGSHEPRGVLMADVGGPDIEDCEGYTCEVCQTRLTERNY